MTRGVHRVCRICGLDWNVSAIDKPGKKYICPHCEWRRQKEAKANEKPKGR